MVSLPDIAIIDADGLDDGWRGCMTELGDLVRAGRAKRGLTQEQLAEAIGRSQNYISDLERGRTRHPGRAALAALAAVLRVPSRDLYAAAGYAVEVRSPDEEEFEWGVPVRDAGPVPADQSQWATADTGAESNTVPVPREWIGARSPRDFLVVTASNDCLSRRGIIAGTSVLLRRYAGEALANGTIILICALGLRALAEFHVRGGAVEVQFCDGELVRFASDGDYQVIGVYAGHWKLEDESE